MKAFPRVSTLSLGAAALLCTPTAHATLADYKNAVTNEAGIISFYTFDQSNAIDSRGLHNGTASGGASFGPGISSGSTALLLDGTGRVNLGLVPDFDFTDTTGSIEAWVRVDWPGTSPGYNPCLFADRNGGPVRWSVHMNGNKSGVGVWNGMGYATLPISAPGTAWHHLVVTFSFGSVEMFWDGVSIGTFAAELAGAANSTQIGSSSSGVTAEGWIGAFDEVAFYADPLSATAVQAHYAAFFAGTPPVITSQPLSGNYLPAVPLRVAVGATGPSLSYQWSKGGVPITGATDSALTFSSLTAGDAGTYRVAVHNPAGDVISSNAVITVTDTLPSPLVQYQTAVVAQPSLLASYSFDRLTADTTVGLYNGFLSGTAYYGQGVDGGPGQGVLLDGSGHVALGTISDFDFADSTGTVEAWVRADWSSSFGSYAPCLFADREGGQVTWSVHMNADKKGLGVWNGSSYQPLPLPDARTDWHHLAVVFDTGTNTIYWDGLALGTREQALGLGSASTQLGSSTSLLTTEGWIGLLDEVAFYADALPPSTIQNHYMAFVGNTRPVITVQPVGGAFYTSQPFEMLVGATGADRTYQWFKNTISIPGATNWNLTFPSLAPADSGDYFVSVSNPSGTTNSITVALQVGNNLGQYQAAVSNETSLISYYTFDVANGADSKGTNNGSVVNLVSFGPGVGLGNDNALVLDGSGHIALGVVPAFDFADGNGTVEAWIRPDWTTNPGYDPTLFANRIASAIQVDWSIHMARFQDVIGNWNGLFYQTAPLPGFSGWHHFAVTFGGDKVAMYWDGQPLGGFSQPIHLTTGLTTQIGSSDPVTTTEGWIGGLDEVAFYRSTLGPDAILNHFLAMVGSAPRPSLSISRSANQVILSWPAATTGYTLEYAPSLTTPAWTPVTGVVNNTVTNDIAAGNRFFRLRK
ncbi:MAG TPA: LamG-like jellyroll fold domain-containing protein [Verrucomicrobiae bacterium]